MRIKLVILGFLFFVLLPVSALLYTGSKTYEPTDDRANSVIANGYILQDSVPEQVYDYTLSRVERYHEKENADAKSYKIRADKIFRDDRGYSFVLEPSDGSDPKVVNVEVENYGDFFAITVRIDGVVQDIS